MSKTSIIDASALKDKLQEYAIKVGRISARPLLLLYFVMVSKDTPNSDKLMILSTISYLVFPVDLISAKRLPIIGWIDEAFSLSVAYQKVSKNITPEIERKTDALLDKWFPEYSNYIGSAELIHSHRLRGADVPPHCDNGAENSPYFG